MEIYRKSSGEDGLETTDFLEAIRGKDMKRINFFLKERSVFQYPLNPLFFALSINDYKIIKILYVNAMNAGGNEHGGAYCPELILPFSTLAYDRYPLVFVKFLKDKDISPYIFFSNSQSILTYSIEKNNMNNLSLLKKRKVEWDKFVRRGYYNPLFFAIKYRNIPLSIILIKELKLHHLHGHVDSIRVRKPFIEYIVSMYGESSAERDVGSMTSLINEFFSRGVFECSSEILIHIIDVNRPLVIQIIRDRCEADRDLRGYLHDNYRIDILREIE